MTDLRAQNENIINEILLTLGYTNVTVTRSKHPNVDFQCNMNEANPTRYEHDVQCNAGRDKPKWTPGTGCSCYRLMDPRLKK